jgi:predicted RNase H-like HicB family nuclease
MSVQLSLEVDREDDGRWIAEVPDLAGVLAYGGSRDEAIARAEALALRVLADRLEHAELGPHLFSVTFRAA